MPKSGSRDKNEILAILQKFVYNYCDMKEEKFRMVNLVKVLSNYVRCNIIEALRNGELSVSAICRIINREQTTVSRNLAIPKKANPVRFRTEGKNVLCRLKNLKVLELFKIARDMVKCHCKSRQITYSHMHICAYENVCEVGIKRRHLHFLCKKRC